MESAPAIANVISGGLFALTAVAAIVAIVQAKIARDALGDARDARNEAEAHEQAALAASEEAARAASRSAVEARRSADALEEANALLRAQLSPPPAWFLVRHDADEYTLTSNLLGVAQFVDVTTLEVGHAEVPLSDHPEHGLVRPGEQLRFRRARLEGSAGPVTLLVTWIDLQDISWTWQTTLP